MGETTIGGNAPIRVQSMTSTATNDIQASVEQCKRICDAGADLVRLTAQGVSQAESIGVIRSQLQQAGYSVPLVADIHFNPRAAFAAAQCTDKVRINPGNFVDVARTFKKLSFTDEEYAHEIQRINEALIPFIEVCRKHKTAVRLGVNHGSLSDRIMSRYGDTPAGMVESVMEFLRVFVAQNFNDVVISIKASNTVIMVETVRRLVIAMEAEGMQFPLHLGVTEAGDGEDGRIKSAVGIGTLLSEGVGDTIRVSLSEDPEVEIPVAQKLVKYITSRQDHTPIAGSEYEGYNALQPSRNKTRQVANVIGGNKQPVVIASCLPNEADSAFMPDFFFAETARPDCNHKFIVPAKNFHGEANAFPLFQFSELATAVDCNAEIVFISIADNIPIAKLEPLRNKENVVIVATPTNMNVTGSLQAFMHALTAAGFETPVIPLCEYADADSEWLQVKSGADFGTLLLNGFRDGIWLYAPNYENASDVIRYEFGILQAARLRMSKTEFISCPSCGRTLFDLQTTVHQVKAATSHLKHLKIGIMGCIVNGPGEMADADYGYVGASAGKISLYKGKDCVEKNIPQEDAIPRLIALIKQNGDWIEP